MRTPWAHKTPLAIANKFQLTGRFQEHYLFKRGPTQSSMLPGKCHLHQKSTRPRKASWNHINAHQQRPWLVHFVAFLWVLKKLQCIPANTWGTFMVKYNYFCGSTGGFRHVEKVSFRKDSFLQCVTELNTHLQRSVLHQCFQQKDQVRTTLRNISYWVPPCSPRLKTTPLSLHYNRAGSKFISLQWFLSVCLFALLLGNLWPGGKQV
mgnify:CR=1 FL=1